MMPYQNYYPNYYPMQDNLSQLRNQSMNQQMYQPQIQQQNQDDRIWVQGEGAAQAYLVAPNSFVRLWDSQSQVFYEKRADQSGRPYMDTFEYHRKGAQEPISAVSNDRQTTDYESKIKALEARIEALERKRGENNAVPESNHDDSTVHAVL